MKRRKITMEEFIAALLVAVIFQEKKEKKKKKERVILKNFLFRLTFPGSNFFFPI